MCRLITYLENADVERSLVEMPTFHIARGREFREVIEQATPSLKTTECTFFNKNLLYLTYGKPSYRVDHDRKATANKSIYPVVIVLQPGAIKPGQVEAVYPFDSGAFFLNRYAQFIEACDDISPFELPNDLESMLKFIRLFFETNTKYYEGSVAGSKPSIGQLEFEVQCYWNLICNYGKTETDGRTSAVELQLNQDLPLTRDNVAAVILPRSFRDDENVARVLEAWDADVKDYMTQKIPIDGYQGALIQKGWEIIEEQGFD